jgi:hypothetical protein
MAMSNLLLHNSKNCWELRHKLTSLFPHLCGGSNGCHSFLDFTWMASHNKPFTSWTRRWRSLYTARGMSCHEIVQVPINKSNHTSFVVSTRWFDFMCIGTFAPIDIILLTSTIFFPRLLNPVYLFEVITFWLGNAKPSWSNAWTITPAKLSSLLVGTL